MTLQSRRAGPVKGVRRQAPSRLREPLKAVMEPAAVTSQTTIFAFLVFSVYICIGIVTGNSERVDNPLKSFLIRAPSKSRSLGGFLFYPFYELFIESPSEGCVAGAFMYKSGIFA